MPEQPPPLTPIRKYLLSFAGDAISFLISATAEWVRRTGDCVISIIILQNERLRGRINPRFINFSKIQP